MIVHGREELLPQPEHLVEVGFLNECDMGGERESGAGEVQKGGYEYVNRVEVFCFCFLRGAGGKAVKVMRVRTNEGTPEKPESRYRLMAQALVFRQCCL